MTCQITHELGHSESVEMTAPPDDSGGKNTIQSIASTKTYLERYTLLAATLTPVGPVGSVIGIELIERKGWGVTHPRKAAGNPR